MKIKQLTLAITLALPISTSFAAALDRSGQSMAAFFQPGNYAEAGISGLDPDVAGQALASYGGQDITDMASDYVFFNAAIKLQPTEHFSFGLLFDQPFGAKAEYSGNNPFVSNANDAVLGSLPITTTTVSSAGGNPAPTGNTQVNVETNNISMIFGYQPNKNFNFYAGPVYQEVKAQVNLRGSAYSIYNGYDAHIDSTEGWGWLAGFAFQIPEIALRVSVTYRSEIDHEMNVDETIPLLDSLTTAASNGSLASLIQSLGSSYPASTISAIETALSDGITANASPTEKTTVSFPQSVNLDFQSGIMADTIAFFNLRWVNWKDFSIQPYKFGLVSEAVGGLSTPARVNGFNLVQYSEDQWSINTGIGRKLNERWSGTVSIGWDSGAGNPVTTLGPTEGYWNLGLGLQYSPSSNYFVQAGLRYFWLGDAKAQTGAQAGSSDYYIAEFEDNYAIAYGLKLGYRF